MAVDKQVVQRPRPVNLNLFTIKFPIPAIISILHRISGLLLFLFIPALLWALQNSLGSAGDFQALSDTLSSPFAKLLIWILLSSLIYHLTAGIRHLIQDLGYGESLAVGRLSAKIVLVFSILMAIGIGIWLW